MEIVIVELSMGRIVSDSITIILALIPPIMLYLSGQYDKSILYIIFACSIIIILFNIVSIIFGLLKIVSPIRQRKIDLLAMGVSFINVSGLMFGEVLAVPGFWSVVPFGFYFVISFSMVLLIVSTMSKVESSVYIILTIPVLALALTCQLVVGLIDLIFPKRVQELIPYIDVTKTFVLNLAQIMANPGRIQAEKALSGISELTDQVEEIAEGYALRKGIGQGIDVGLTIVVFGVFGVLTVLTDDFEIDPTIALALFGSLALALSTFAGLFGPFYGLAGSCKKFMLKHGNYRGASVYKILEQIFAIPFMAAAAGFLFLDLPPIDADSLDDFKNDMQEQITEIGDSVNSLLGTDKSAIPRKTRKMIASIMNATKHNLSSLDFREIREDSAREFALTYYQHEFPWRPWARKRAVREFAEKYYFDLETAEDSLKLIGFKILEGQMTDDMVNNVMISSAMRGVIMMENQHNQYFEAMELGQTCTGLAFGARQFLKDHYLVATKKQKIFRTTKNFIMGLFAIPIVLVISFHEYANSFYDKLVNEIEDIIFEGRLDDILKIRYYEINQGFKLAFNKPEKVKETKTKEQKMQRNWQIGRKFKRLVSMIWEVVIFPVLIILNVLKWIYHKIRGVDESKETFEEEIAHAALVSMYDELYKKLVMQTHLSTGF
ncbi:MAG: hypothetical protein OEZ01_02215 [Candidatus Heimdallarchaeota archaeon]|nr:hypothetical protein [Candidatus Heimdallarchaeota archaeon]MDH5644790.1 hypothetical protein [Candidatus Heimdallarchaeota archaeon]